jgi:hypothetical protein
LRIALLYLVQYPAEGVLTVGSAYRPEVYKWALFDPLELAVVRKCPVAPPQLAAKWMRVFEANLTPVCEPDMADDGMTFYRIFLN